MELRARSNLVWKNWEGEHTIYNPASGDLHLLDEVGATALRCLESVTLTESELSAELSEQLQIENDDGLRQYVARLVADLDCLGLLEQP